MQIEEIGTWIGGAGGAAMLLRMGITMLKKQGLADATLDAHAAALKNAQTEAKKWEDKYDAEVKNHSDCRHLYEATLKLLGAMENNNQMLRMLLLQRGMTAQEIDTALGVIHGV